MSGDDLQLIGCSVVGLGNGSTAYNALLNGIDYGNRIEFKAVLRYRHHEWRLHIRDSQPL